MTVWGSFFSQRQPVSGVGAIQMVLWFWSLIWFVPLALPMIDLFDLPLYADMRDLVSESIWACVMGFLVVFPPLVDLFMRENSRLKIRIFIGISIFRSGVAGFTTTMFFRASPTGIAAPLQGLMVLLALWVVWRLSYELHR